MAAAEAQGVIDELQQCDTTVPQELIARSITCLRQLAEVGDDLALQLRELMQMKIPQPLMPDHLRSACSEGGGEREPLTGTSPAPQQGAARRVDQRPRRPRKLKDVLFGCCSRRSVSQSPPPRKLSSSEDSPSVALLELALGEAEARAPLALSEAGARLELQQRWRLEREHRWADGEGDAAELLELALGEAEARAPLALSEAEARLELQQRWRLEREHRWADGEGDAAELPEIPYQYDTYLGAGQYAVVVRVLCSLGKPYAAKLMPLATGSDITPPGREVALAALFRGEPHLTGLLDFGAAAHIEDMPPQFLRAAQSRHVPQEEEPVCVQRGDGAPPLPAVILDWGQKVWVRFTDGSECEVEKGCVQRHTEMVAVAAVIMREYDTGSLADYVEKKGSLQPADLERLLIHGARGLRALHKHNHAHCDVHSRNMLMHRLPCGGHLFALSDLGSCSDLCEATAKRDAWGLALACAVGFGMKVCDGVVAPHEEHRTIQLRSMHVREPSLIRHVASFLPRNSRVATVVIELLGGALFRDGESTTSISGCADYLAPIGQLGPLPPLSCAACWPPLPPRVQSPTPSGGSGADHMLSEGLEEA